MEGRMLSPPFPVWPRRGASRPCGEGQLEIEPGCGGVPILTGEPAFITLLSLGLYRPRCELRDVVAKLRLRQLGAGGGGGGTETSAVAPRFPVNDDPWDWARREHVAGRHQDLSVNDLVALRLCGSTEFLVPLSRVLQALHGDAMVAEEERCLWEDFVFYVSSGFSALQQVQQRRHEKGSASPQRLCRAAWIPSGEWKERWAGAAGEEICFAGVQSAAEPEELWGLLGTQQRAKLPGTVPCLLEFDARLAGTAVEARPILPPGDGDGDDGLRAREKGGQEYLLPPYLQGRVQSITEEALPGEPGQTFFRVCVAGREVAPALPAVLDSPVERILAASLFVGLYSSPPAGAAASPAGRRRSALLEELVQCLGCLSAAVEAKNAGDIDTVWKSYWECLLEDVHSYSWKNLMERMGQAGVLDVCRSAALDVVTAARGVAKRALGFSSCVDHEAMREELTRREKDAELKRWDALEVARRGIRSLCLETLTDPEAFIQFMHHDPVCAFEAAPAAVQAHLVAEPAQKVFIFAKLMALVALAASLLRGEPTVLEAFNSPFPLAEDPWSTWLAACALRVRRSGAARAGAPGAASAPAAEGASPSVDGPVSRREHATRAVGLVQLQRLRLARTRLLVVGGAPDVGKTTLLREGFGFRDLPCGPSRQGRTEQLSLLPHPAGDPEVRPVYLVDTPGFGDGEQLHRNDMGRILRSIGGWLPGGVTLVWVFKAGRHVQQVADELLRSMLANDPAMSLVVIVTHVDRLFEERYRDAGPRWRETELQGVAFSDPRWRQRRKLLMEELQDEVSSAVMATFSGGGRDDSILATTAASLDVATECSSSSSCGGGGGGGGGGGCTAKDCDASAATESSPVKPQQLPRLEVCPEIRYACLGGWMSRHSADGGPCGGEEEEEDEFAEPPPWPWARRELTEHFRILGRRELRSWLDAKLGL